MEWKNEKKNAETREGRSLELIRELKHFAEHAVYIVNMTRYVR